MYIIIILCSRQTKNTTISIATQKKKIPKKLWQSGCSRVSPGKVVFLRLFSGKQFLRVVLSHSGSLPGMAISAFFSWVARLWSIIMTPQCPQRCQIDIEHPMDCRLGTDTAAVPWQLPYKSFIHLTRVSHWRLLPFQPLRIKFHVSKRVHQHMEFAVYWKARFSTIQAFLCHSTVGPASGEAICSNRSRLFAPQPGAAAIQPPHAGIHLFCY